MPNRLFALLAGIDRYANSEQAPPLRGCVADVEGSYALLTSRFGVPPAQVRLLTARLDQSEPDEARASRANLLRGWQEHLGQAGSGDLVFFHYSGYGSQARSLDPAGPGGFEPTIVPSDSRTPGVFDLTAQELAALSRRIEGRGAQVIMLLDCCHTPGSARRIASEAGAAAVRRCPPDGRLRPPESLLRDEAATDAGPTPAKHGPSGWLPLGRHVLLAACRDGEVAYEYEAPDDDGWRGAVSYFFQQMLAASPPGITWAQLHDAILAQLHAVYPGQTPQLEGPSHLEVFGSAGRERTSFLLVQEVESQEYVRVNGGAAAGLTPGSRLALYPPA
ncbi:MAG TPA: caspase family protein, partial [Caldilineaceae bacterium]|nr:caspase family protein [Caldilineaceae bacterium]